jgi:hypothetical protein
MIWKRLGRGLRIAGTAALVAAAAVERTAAVEVQCIEESKYKHLYALFGGDASKFATYLKVGADRLPDPEACRAVLIAGGIGEPNDRDKLLDVVVRNKGWLATVYLNSGGGNVWTGQQLGYVVRAFRLKTVTARNVGNKVLYEPDFALAPLSSPYPAPPAATAGIPDAGQPVPPRCFLHEHVPLAVAAKDVRSGITRPEAFKPTYDENVDRPGGDYRRIDLTNADPKLCQKTCLDDQKCRAWSYRKADGGAPQCGLKERVLGRVDDRLAVSGIVRADVADATYDENVDRPGGDYRQFDLTEANPRLCQKSCLDETRCRAWSYRKPEGRTNGKPHCALKDRAPATSNDRLNVTGVVSRWQYLEPTYDESVERPGSNYREFDLPSADPKLCQKTCLDEARCRAWSYRKPEGMTNRKPHCAVKDHVPTQLKQDNLNISGMVIRTDRFEPTDEEGADRSGLEYRHVDLTSPDPHMCQKACAEDGKCRTWTYEEPNGAFLAALAAGWDTYRDRQRSIVSKPSPGNNFCASSCVQIQVAGLDRSGSIQVHRPNIGYAGNLTNAADALTTSDAHMPEFYKYMDAGPAVTALMQATSSQTVTTTLASRFPRYILDYLIVHCGVDPEQLQGLERQVETSLKELNPAAPDVSFKLDHLRAALGKIHERRRRAEQCVAQAAEQDRLAAYDKLCGQSCDEKKLGAEFDDAVKKIVGQTR